MGPLQNVKVVEIAGIGPGPFCGMLLADLGAEVLRIDRPDGSDLGLGLAPRFNLLNRGRRSVAVDLKTPEGRDLVLDLAGNADILFEGFRPGVMERLGLGPDDVAKVNQRLVYGRITGWGQTGPMAAAAGHDLNYIALGGALDPIGPRGGAPLPPLNLVGDFGGGGMLLALGLLAALVEARQSGRGQVVDAAMVDGSALLMTMFFGLRAAGLWSDQRGDNLLDGGAPWYGTYATADGKFISVAAIEPKFYRQLIEFMGLREETLPPQQDRRRWPELREIFSRIFASRSQADWCRIMEGSDACFAPVLGMADIATHPHMVARQTIVVQDGVAQPAPAPRFSRTGTALRNSPCRPGEHTRDALADWGIPRAAIEALIEAGTIRALEG